MWVTLRFGRMLLVVVLIAAVGCGAEGEHPLARQGRDVVDDLFAERFDEVREAMHPRLANALTEEALAKAWADAVRKNGNLREIGAAKVEERGEFTLVRIPLVMAEADAMAELTYDSDGTVVAMDLH